MPHLAANNHPRPRYNPLLVECHLCPRTFRNRSGLTQHHHVAHATRPPSPPDNEGMLGDLNFARRAALWTHLGCLTGLAEQLEHPLGLDVDDEQFDPEDEVEVDEEELDLEPRDPRQAVYVHAEESIARHPHLSGKLRGPILHKTVHVELCPGRPCNAEGTDYLPEDLPPAPRNKPDNTDWTPFHSRLEFEVAEFLYKKDQMSQGHVTHLMDLWAASLIPYGAQPPFTNCDDMLASIDSITHGDAPWFCFEVSYEGPLPEGNVPSWMTEKYMVWTRDIRTILHIMIKNEDFDGEFNYSPYAELDPEGKHILTNLMSGNWAWRQAVRERSQHEPSESGESVTEPNFTGHNRRGSHDAWGNVRPSHPWERQDDRVCCNRSQRVLSSIRLPWERA